MVKFSKYESRGQTKWQYYGHAGVDPKTGDKIKLRKKGFSSKAEAKLHYDHKGAPDTFDVGGYVALLGRVRRADGVVLAPDYRRDLHEPVAASLPIEVDGVVITEGNYLGLELPGWADVRGLIDLLVYIETPLEELAARLIDRHVSFGRDRADAAHWVRTVDAANMALVERTKERANLVLSL